MGKQYDLIIIGAGPAGISAATYACRAKLKTLIIDSGESGGQIRITSEVVNYPGILSISGAELSDTMRKQAMSFGAEMLHAEITDIDLSADWKKISTNQGDFEALTVIIATGAKPRLAGFRGEEEYRGRGIGYCATCDGEFFAGLDVFVVGGGFAAAEEALFLTRYARKVTILVRKDRFSCSPSIVEKVQSHPKIEVKFNHVIEEVTGEGVLKKAVLRNTETGELTSYTPPEGESFGVFVFAGYVPMSDFVKDQVDTNEQGYITTDETMATNVPGVFAAGDIRPKILRQLVTAASDGAIASTSAEHYIHEKRAQMNLPEFSDEKATENESPSAQQASLLDDDLKEQLGSIFDRFENDVFIEVKSGIDKELQGQLLAFAQEIECLSSKIHLIEPEGENQNAPSIKLYNHERAETGITYQAVPGGHELNSFVLALYNVAGPGQELTDDTLQAIKSLPEQSLQVGMTLSCTMCPDVVQATQLIALHNPEISLEIIDISRNADFRSKHQLMSVPALVIDEEQVIFGKKNLDQILELLH